MVVCAGTVMSDLNTIRFSVPVDIDKTIDIQGTYTIVENVRYDNVLMKDILKKLAQGVEKIDTPMPETGADTILNMRRLTQNLLRTTCIRVFRSFWNQTTGFLLKPA